MRNIPVESPLPSEWQPIVSGNAQLRLASVTAGGRPALRMDFDFQGGAGFVVARRAWSVSVPEQYAVTFRLRGRGPVNNFELKLVDASGQNVWRHVQKNLKLPPRWKRFTIDSRDIEFAWGPSSGGRPALLGSLEFAIVAGEGGQGSVWIGDVQIENRTPSEAPQAAASSAMPEFEAHGALSGGGWKPHPEDPHPWIEIDSIEPRVIGGLIIEWLEGAPANGFRIRGSLSGRSWKTLYSAKAAGGVRSYVYLPGLETRCIRLEINEPSAGASIRLQSFEFSRSIHAFWHEVADHEPRGWHPRWLHNEQSVWTPFGTANGIHCGLMNGDGMVEVTQGSFSIEPMLLIDGKLFTWADLTPRQELLDGWIPVPSVIWEAADWRLTIQAEATPGGVSRVHYRFENLGGAHTAGRLFVLVRPFQVTPPWQSFRDLGGVSPVRDLKWCAGALEVNGAVVVAPAIAAGTAGQLRFGALRFDQGIMAARLAAGSFPLDAAVQDAFGFATGAFEFGLSAAPRESVENIVNCKPLGSAASIDEPGFEWRDSLPVHLWSGADWMTDVAHAALTCTAHVLLTRSGPALQPGPRRYTRSWIRDGAMMSAALLRMGHAEEVREFIRWYAPHQRADGFVPCCVDSEGIDWLVEHDSHGQLLALIADYHRFSADDAFLAESWPFIEKAVGCIEGLIGEDGLLPISVSHEGYLAQPVHSYWDDFWALRGLQDAVHLARATGRDVLGRRWEESGTRLARSLYASIEMTRASRNLDFIPGSIEWADFDPTATANAIYLLDVPPDLNRAAVEQTFDKYLTAWRGKRDGSVISQNYTPYEIRIIGALVRLGRRDAALELLRFFMSDRRPRPWNQWPEIAWRDTRAPAHLGDLPHTWIAAEFVLAVRSLFAYERESDRSLIVASGLAPEWIEGDGVRVRDMPTLYGDLSYAVRRLDYTTVCLEIGGTSAVSVLLRPPLPGALRQVTVNDRPCTSFDEISVTLPGSPALVIFTTA